MKKTFKPRVCVDCKDVFIPTCGTHVRCPECGERHKARSVLKFKASPIKVDWDINDTPWA